jgi:hypothetical protein
MTTSAGPKLISSPAEARRMRSIVVLVILAAGSCGDGPADPHALARCDETWARNGFEQCEAACVDSMTALLAAGAACKASTSAGTLVDCSKTFAFEGITGCCSAAPPRLHFAECQ